VLSSSQKFAAIVTEIYQVDNSESGIKPLISTDESDLAIKAARENPSKPPFTGDIPPIEKMSRAATGTSCHVSWCPGFHYELDV
jgi:hypothetical protein